MYPVIKIFFLSVNSYVFFIIFGFWAAFLYAVFFLKKRKEKFISENEQLCIFVCLFFSSMPGAKAVFLFAERPDIFWNNPLSVFKIWEGGFVYYGGLIGAVICLIAYVYVKKIPLRPLSDIVAPCLAINVFFIRTGCFFTGCCYGRESSLPWAMNFGGRYLHPTQLYEAAGCAVLFLFLHFYNKKRFGHGKTLALYIVGYAAVRFVTEFFRGDERGAYHFGLSISQNIALITFAAALIILLYGAGKYDGKNNIRKI
jgi:phosphatidylglycerol:prolipoprotein diacylglycerol transferase